MSRRFSGIPRIFSWERSQGRLCRPAVIATVTGRAYTLDRTGIRSTDDFLHALRDHPEWQEAVRMELLTLELLNMPSIVGELAQAQNRTESSMENLNVKVESLIDQQSGMLSSLTYLV